MIALAIVALTLALTLDPILNSFRLHKEVIRGAQANVIEGAGVDIGQAIEAGVRVSHCTSLSRRRLLGRQESEAREAVRNREKMGLPGGR